MIVEGVIQQPDNDRDAPITERVYLKHAGTDAGAALLAADASSAVPGHADVNTPG